MTTLPNGEFSGPHICVQVGADTMRTVRAALLEACSHHGGQLDADGIKHVLDLLIAMPEFYGVFRRGYNHCMEMHEQPLTRVSGGQALARFIIQTYCRDVALRVFKRQIQQFGAQWLGQFLDGLLAWLESHGEGGFTDRLQERYRALSMQDGPGLNLSTLLGDKELVGLVAERMGHLRNGDGAELRRLENTINRRLSDAFAVTGPSIAKLNDDNFGLFIRKLADPAPKNAFRNSVNDRLAA